MCVLIFCTAFETFLTLRIPQGTAVNLHWSSRKVPVILVILKRNQNFLLVRVELCHADGRIDGRHDEANSCFSKFLRMRLKTAFKKQ
jgi:hypothetical protein